MSNQQLASPIREALKPHFTQSTPSHGTGIASVVAATAVVLWAVATVGGVRVSRWLTPVPEPSWHPRLAALPPGPPIELSAAIHGREVFERACAQCHDSTGLGKQGLGKNLVRSDFVADQADAALVAFVIRGRPITDPLNTTKVPMPPKGGVESLTEDDISGVVMYVRGLQDPRRMPALPAWVPPPVVVSEQEKQDALAAAGGDKELAGFIANGSRLFATTCIACHGPAGAGIKGNGKVLRSNEFIKSQDDDHLLAFIKRGRDPSDPKNTTGIGMPPKGGNPAFSDDDLLDIISYLRSLQGVPPAVSPTK